VGTRSTSRSARSILAAALLVLSTAAAPRSALGVEGTKRTTVDVAVSDPSNDEADALVQAFEDLGASSRLHMNLSRRGDEPPEVPWPDDVLARVWIDAREPDHVDIRVSRRGGGPLPAPPEERVLPREGSRAVLVEAVAQVLRAELDSMADIDAQESAVPADAPATPIPPAPEAPRPPSLHDAEKKPGGSSALDLAAFGTEEALSARSGPVTGAGVGLGVSAGRAPWRPGLWASASFDSRFDAQGGQVVFDVAATSFRLVPTLEVVELEAAQLDVGVGAGLDLLRVSPLVVRSSNAVLDTPVRWADPVVTGQIVMRLRIAPQVSATFGLDLDYDLSPHVTDVPGNRPGTWRGSFELWQLRPTVSFGLCVRLWGDGAPGRSR
jgi:hypothetical protein